jgi:hypothetical protein
LFGGGSWREFGEGVPEKTGTFKEEGTPALVGLKSGKPLRVITFDASLQGLVAFFFLRISTYRDVAHPSTGNRIKLHKRDGLVTLEA